MTVVVRIYVMSGSNNEDRIKHGAGKALLPVAFSSHLKNIELRLT